MLRKLRLSLLTTLYGTSLSCALKPPDIFACKSLEPVSIKGVMHPSPTCKRTIGEDSCGYCTYTISDKSFVVGNRDENRHNGVAWAEMLDQSVILPARESFAPLKAYIINSCKMTNCDSVISNWRFRLEELDNPSR